MCLYLHGPRARGLTESLLLYCIGVCITVRSKVEERTHVRPFSVAAPSSYLACREGDATAGACEPSRREKYRTQFEVWFLTNRKWNLLPANHHVREKRDLKLLQTTFLFHHEPATSSTASCTGQIADVLPFSSHAPHPRLVASCTVYSAR